MKDSDRFPNLELLVACGAQAARAMGQREADQARTLAFFRDILHRDQRLGGRDIWDCLTVGLITETEARDAVMAYFATWLSRGNGVREPSSETWSSPELEQRFEMALLGRRANHAP